MALHPRRLLNFKESCACSANMPGRFMLQRIRHCLTNVASVMIRRTCLPHSGKNRPCHGSGSLSPASHHGVSGSRPGKSTWNLWLTKCHCNRFLSEFFGFPLSIPFHHGSPYSYITWGMNNSQAGGRISETCTHPNDMNKGLCDCERAVENNIGPQEGESNRRLETTT
jgi:hypothetical protein